MLDRDTMNNDGYDWTSFHQALDNYRTTTPWPAAQDEFDAYTKGLADIVLLEQEKYTVHLLMKEVSKNVGP